MAATEVVFDSSVFETSLRAALSTMKLKSDAEAETLAYAIATGAKLKAPVRSGRLRSSIDVQRGEDAKGKYFDVGSYLVYAPFVEFGTRFMTPRAFMRSSILEAVTGWQPRIMP